MTAVKEPNLGRFSIDIELANDKDLIQAEAGYIAPDKVRKTTVRGVVDSGATRLVISESVAKRLGVEVSGSTKVRYADGRTADRPIAHRIHLTYAGRDSVFTAVVEPERESALIGAIVLEELDFLVDCSGQRLVPRDSKQIVSEVE